METELEKSKTRGREIGGRLSVRKLREKEDTFWHSRKNMGFGVSFGQITQLL